jgi:hypothetical protein
MRIAPLSRAFFPILLSNLLFGINAQTAGQPVCKQCMTGTSGQCQASDSSCWPLTSAGTCPPLTSVCTCPLCPDGSTGTCRFPNGTCVARHPASSCPLGTWECVSSSISGLTGVILYTSPAPSPQTASALRNSSVDQTKSASVAIIVGAVVGSLFGTAMLGMCVYYVSLCKRRAHVQPEPKAAAATDNPPAKLREMSASLPRDASSVSLNSMNRADVISGKIVVCEWLLCTQFGRLRCVVACYHNVHHSCDNRQYRHQTRPVSVHSSFCGSVCSSKAAKSSWYVTEATHKRPGLRNRIHLTQGERCKRCNACNK